MAEDRLMFPLGFDLDSATKEAEKEWGSKYAAQLEKALQKRPIKIKLDYDIKQLGNLEAVQKRLKELKVAPVTPETKGAISSLVSELQKLESILKRIDRLNAANAKQNASTNAANELAAQRAARTAEITARTNAKAQRDAMKLAIEQERLNQAKIRTVQAEERYRRALDNTNKAYSSTEGYISRLIKRSAVLFGIHQVSRFTQKLRETTAEFELQRVSLGAIIQDTEKANALFNQIKTFAVQSPFEIKDLVGYVKQLSAYRIETDKLFDTTKRLADVSAGLGVDMGRLILAYGQVKAASVLRGQEVRQFTEAGIPLIQLLADKFTALRGEVVSTSEVFDLISKRAVSFEMVAEIFEDMTNAGGMFYNMQEKQAQTLAGQWSNLKDSLSIMYDEIGNTKGAHAAMESMINLTKTLADNWELVGSFIIQTLGGAAIVGVVNKFKSLWNMLGVQMYSATTKVELAQKRYNAVLAEYSALSKNATRLEREAIVVKYQSAKAALASAKATEAAAASTNRLTFAWKKFTAALKANWISIVLGLLVTLGQVIAHVVRKANELKNTLADIDKEGAHNLNKSVYNFERLAKKAVEAADGSRQQKEALDELHRTYRDMIPVQDMTIDKLRELKGNYEALTQAVREYINQQTFENKINAITETYGKKINDLKNSLKKFLLSKPLVNLFDWDKEQVGALLAEVEKNSSDTSKSFKDIWLDAFSEVFGYTSDSFESWVDGMIVNNRRLQQLPDSVREFDNAIKEVTDDMAESTGYVGKYRKEWEALQKSVKNIEVGFLDDGQETFLSRQDRLNQSVNLYAQAIKDAVEATNKDLAEAGEPLIELQDEWFNLVDAIDEANPSRVSNIQIDAIIKGVAGKYPQLKKYLNKIQEEYYKLVPQDRTVQALKSALFDYADTAKISMENVSQYLMNSDENIQQYAERVKNELAEVTSELAEIALVDDLISQGKGLGVLLPTSEEDKAALKERQEALEYLVQLTERFQKKSSKGGSGTDDRLSKLKEEVSLLEKIYNNYKKYTEYESKSDAQARINREFGKTLRIFEKYGIELPKTAEEYQAALGKLQDAMRGLPKSEKDVLELGFKIEQVNFDESKRNLEDELKRLAEEVSRTKTAKEFFDKMLNMTGDKELSATVTMSVYGDTGKGLHDAIVAQIREAFKGIDQTELSLAIGVDTIDYKKLREIWESDKLLPDDLRKIPSAYDKTIQEILNNAEKANADWLLDTFKMYEQFKTFEEQRTTITEQETEKRNQINANASLTEEQRASLLTASLRREVEKLNDIDWAEFKASEDWIKTFEGIDRIATPTIERLIDKLRELIETHKDLTPEQLRTIMNEYNKLYNELIQRNPFKAIIDGIKEYSEATGKLKEARKQYKDLLKSGIATEEQLAEALKKVNDAQDEQIAALSKIQQSFERLSNVASNLQSILSQVVDLFGVAEDSEVGAFLSELGKMLGIIATVLSVIASVLALIDTLAAPVLAVIAAIAALGAVISWIAGIKERKTKKQIEKIQKAIDALSESYERLKEVQEKLFGAEFIANLRDQEDAIISQIKSYEEQIKILEKLKKRQEFFSRYKKAKATQEEIDKINESIKETQKELESLAGTLSEHFLGSDLTSAARSFAQSWVQAYKEFGDTADAIEEEMETLMENLMTEAVLGAIAEQALKPLFDYIDNLSPTAFSLEDTWKEIFRLQQDAQKNMNTGLSVGAQYLEQMGILTRDMGGELTGITKDLASASEETMQGVAAEFNTLNYFVSHIDTTVSQMLYMMFGGDTEFSSNEQIADLITIQNQHLAYLPNIALNTAQTAERCERAAQACESIAENLNRVVKPKGVSGTYQVNCSL